MGLLKKISKTGWIYSFAIIFNRAVPAWLFRCRRFVVYELDPDSFDGPANEQLKLSWCKSPTEIEKAVELSYFDPSTSEGENFACQSVLDGKLVGALWKTGGCFVEKDLGVEIVLAPQQNWLFSAYVDRSVRNSGIYSSILRFVLSELKQQGVHSPLVAVNPDNLGSNYIHAKHAANSPGTVLAIRFFKLAVCFASGRLKPDRWLTLNCRKNPIRLEIVSIQAAEPFKATLPWRR